MQILQIDNSLSCKGAVESENGCFLAFEREPVEQGSDLRKITGSPNVRVHEILGPQTCTLNEKSEFSVARRQKLVACGTRALLEHIPVEYVDS